MADDKDLWVCPSCKEEFMTDEADTGTDYEALMLANEATYDEYWIKCPYCNRKILI